MTEVRPKRTAHRGSVRASGIAVDARTIGVEGARRRLLELRAPGTEVFEAGPILIAIFREPMRVQHRAAAGAPLVRYGRALSSAPLDAKERAAIDDRQDTVFLVEGGVLVAVEPTPVDVASWIDTSDFEVIRGVESLGRVATDPAPSMIPVADVRASLGAEPMTAAARDVVRALMERPEATGRLRGPSLWTRLVELIRVLTRSIGATPADRPPHRSWWAQLVDAMNHTVARALVWTRLASIAGRRQAEYLARMLEMFDSNRLDEALRHAIPLSDRIAEALRPSLGTPSPRSDLSIVPRRGAASTSIGLGPDLYELLRQRYRRAFERLVARGEIEKAAFVLAELLGADEEAVSFLERHGRFLLAAQVAEARGLRSGLVIRQWFLAGDRARALRIARRTGAYADAVARLERSHAKEARAFRILWADALASSGAYAAAVDVIWPVEDARRVAVEWIDRAIDVGGPTGARMLVRKASAQPEAIGDVRDRARSLLEEDDLPIALALGRAASQGDPTGEIQVLSRMAARALLGHVSDPEVDRVADGLLALGVDPALRADAHGPVRRREGSVRVRAHGSTHAGRVRSFNEDHWLAEPGTERSPTILAVFDGLGGFDTGDHAAKLAASAVALGLRQTHRAHGRDEREWGRCVLAAVERANRALIEDMMSAPSRRGSGCTATVASLSGTTLFFAQVGDTRGYVFRDRRLAQITRDHTLLQDYIDAGRLSADEIEAFPHKSVIVRCLGMADDVKVDLFRVEIQDGDLVLLATDGLWTEVDHETIASILGAHAPPERAAEALLARALETRAADNIAIVVARLEAKGAPADGRPIVFAPYAPPALEISSSPIRPMEHRRVSADRGAYPIHDAVELPDGKVLVALGDVGAWIVARDGRVVARIAEPAEAIVPSIHGDRAILVARRGEALRLSRVDLVSKRARPWCDARADVFASSFDGATWFVGRGSTVYAIEAAARGWSHSWTVDEPHGAVSAIEHDERALEVRFSRMEGEETWRYELPSMTLRHRARTSGRRWAVHRDGGALRVEETRSGEVRLHVALEGAARAGARLAGDRAIVFDDCGRVLVIGIEDGRVVREHRIA